MSQCASSLEGLVSILERMQTKLAFPKVGIIIPIYNAETHIQALLRPLCHQTYRNFKIFIVDDASTDHSLAEIKNVLAHTRIESEILALPHRQGSLKARNLGLNRATKAKMDLIILLQADSIVSTTWIEKNVNRRLTTKPRIFYNLPQILNLKWWNAKGANETTSHDDFQIREWHYGGHK